MEVYQTYFQSKRHIKRYQEGILDIHIVFIVTLSYLSLSYLIIVLNMNRHIHVENKYLNKSTQMYILKDNRLKTNFALCLGLQKWISTEEFSNVK